MGEGAGARQAQAAQVGMSERSDVCVRGWVVVVGRAWAKWLGRGGEGWKEAVVLSAHLDKVTSVGRVAGVGYISAPPLHPEIVTQATTQIIKIHLP
eukprot:57834-Chlamydomonas_euryale.AAC.1